MKTELFQNSGVLRIVDPAPREILCTRGGIGGTVAVKFAHIVRIHDVKEPPFEPPISKLGCEGIFCTRTGALAPTSSPAVWSVA